MRRKVYQMPSLKVIMLHQKSHLLAGSGTDTVRGVPDGWNWGEPGDDR